MKNIHKVRASALHVGQHGTTTKYIAIRQMLQQISETQQGNKMHCRQVLEFYSFDIKPDTNSNGAIIISDDQTHRSMNLIKVKY